MDPKLAVPNASGEVSNVLLSDVHGPDADRVFSLDPSRKFSVLGCLKAKMATPMSVRSISNLRTAMERRAA